MKTFSIKVVPRKPDAEEPAAETPVVCQREPERLFWFLMGFISGASIGLIGGLLL